MKSLCVVIGQIVIAISISASAHAGIIDLSQWTLVQVPPHLQLTSTIDSNTQISLKAAGGPIPNGTDIGYQSVNGFDVGARLPDGLLILVLVSPLPWISISHSSLHQVDSPLEWGSGRIATGPIQRVWL